ncbi:MAG: tetratricopeptide repeat protein [Sandaracinus sp.]|nr:tetratricopeptide repeat protein [Sandaracinus sp.]MCB9616053.1 tetratricopeptide repeat protein [Sandaracinus sp.]MCB9621354.1 tetratricopeptide repeat protein [Sandaracinus sp.]MCB9632436.1 tetratricopeptide repeat protein [Sandaracinus sp.]
MKNDDAERALAEGRLGEAQTAYLDRLRAAPDDDDALVGLGRTFLAAGSLKHAFGCFQKVVSRSPSHAPAWRWLGLTRHRLGLVESAEEALATSATLAPNDVETQLLLGGVQLAQDRPAEAERAFRRASHMAPRDVRAWHGLGSSLAARGLADDAREAFERGLALEPGSLTLRWAHLAASPLVHASAEDLEAEDARAERASRELASFVDDRSRTALAGALSAIQDNFRAHYRGKDVTTLQRRHGRMVHRVVGAALPELVTPLPKRPRREGRVRVGFLSSCFRSHTVLELFERWITELDATDFEVFVYQLGQPVDARTAALARAVEHFHHEPRDLRALGARVREDALDVLVFPEVGMDRRVMSLAATRLAPVQVTTCGHPVTTGLPTLDVFLGGEDVEPPEAEAHYTERLVRLPGLGLTPRVPAAPAELDPDERVRVRASLGLPTEGPLLLCCQSLFKYLPEHDDVLVRIADALPDATAVFLSHPTSEVTGRFRARLDRAFAERGLVAGSHTRILPRLAHADYLALNRASDLFLDSFEFSAGRSGFEAIAMGLVPVTCPGRFARGRYLAAALKGVELPELVAADEDAYVATVVALARDSERRARLSARLRDRAPALFAGQATLEGFRRFLLSAATRVASAA